MYIKGSNYKFTLYDLFAGLLQTARVIKEGSAIFKDGHLLTILSKNIGLKLKGCARVWKATFRTQDVFGDWLNFEQNEMKEATILLKVTIYQENRDYNLMKLTSYRKDQVWIELEKCFFFLGDEFTLCDWGKHLHTKAVSFADNMMMVHVLHIITVKNK